MSKAHNYIYIVGPTGVGKTELSISVAQSLNYPILNCDSVQVYQSVDIGTAKPDKKERSQANHYLFDYVPEGQIMTAAQYLDDVVECIESHNIENLVFVGGSGFYVQALEKGLYPNSETPEEVKSFVNLWIEEKGYAFLYEWIKERDPEFSLKISDNDHYRIRRAVEVMKTQNKTMTALKKEMAEINYSPLPKNRSVKVGLHMEKDELRERIEIRTDKMLNLGLVEEVKLLLDKGLASWAPMSSVGYKECVDYIQGALTQAELREKIITSTMQLIKKQKTWFKRDKSIHWFDRNELDSALEFIESWSKGS